jgi:hypothetical protein
MNADEKVASDVGFYYRQAHLGEPGDWAGGGCRERPDAAPAQARGARPVSAAAHLRPKKRPASGPSP